MRRPATRLLFLCTIGASIVGLGTGLWLIFTPSAPPVLPPLPVPNGYDDLVRAGGLVIPSGELDIEAGPLEEVRSFVESNAEALKLLRAALEHESRVPLRFSPHYFSSHAPEIMAVLAATNLLRADARLAESSKDPRKAAQAYVELVRLGLTAGEGGLTIDRIGGITNVEAGLRGLLRLKGQLIADEWERLVDTLRKVLARREPVEAVLERDQAFFRAAYSPFQRWNLEIALYQGGWGNMDVEGFLTSREASIARLLEELAGEAAPDPTPPPTSPPR